VGPRDIGLELTQHAVVHSVPDSCAELAPRFDNSRETLTEEPTVIRSLNQYLLDTRGHLEFFAHTQAGDSLESTRRFLTS
jgi:hypothetical protein